MFGEIKRPEVSGILGIFEVTTLFKGLSKPYRRLGKRTQIE